MVEKNMVHPLQKVLGLRNHRDRPGSPRKDPGSEPQAISKHPQPYSLKPVIPEFCDDELYRLNGKAQDYLMIHGGLLKTINQKEPPPGAQGQTIGTSLHPSSFPRRLFQEACELQVIFQELYIAISQDADWLKLTLKDLIESDPLTKVLWSIFEAVKDTPQRIDAPISCAIFRSDYMIQGEHEHHLRLKQVEFNTIACAGAVHGQRVQNMHRHLHRSGAYAMKASLVNDKSCSNVNLDIPEGDNTEGVCSVLQLAHYEYLRQYNILEAGDSAKTCVLMVVQPNNFNIADERPIEYALCSKSPLISCFRIEWGEDMLNLTSTTSSGALLFKPTWMEDVYEVSVVYFRAGFEPHEFKSHVDYEMRVRFEKSRAVKCPDILTHLAGSKRVQQALIMPGVLERFVEPEKADRLRTTFMQMYPLDGSALGSKGKEIATDPRAACDYVLKPSRDGGGHNIYREDICTFLKKLPENKWPEYTLMKLIRPALSQNVLVSSLGIWLGDVIAELGIWGGAVWKRDQAQSSPISNRQVGWSVRSKNPDIDEMSVVKGYGSFDSIALVDEETNDKTATEKCIEN